MNQATPERDEGFERDVVAAFAFVSRGTPTIGASSYDPRAFGNAVVELEGAALRVRVTRDREQFLVDLSPADRHDWFDEEIVLRFVGADADADALIFGEWKSLQASAAAIHRHLQRIRLAVGAESWPEVRGILKELQNRRAQALFGGQE
jgi:hypothetical protein